MQSKQDDCMPRSMSATVTNYMNLENPLPRCLVRAERQTPSNITERHKPAQPQIFDQSNPSTKMRAFIISATVALLASLASAAPAPTTPEWAPETRQFQAQITFFGADSDASFSLSVPTDGSEFSISKSLVSITPSPDQVLTNVRQATP